LKHDCVGFKESISVVEAKGNGQIIVNLTKPLLAKERGVLLFDLEEFLKNVIDPSLVVWLQPLGDRN